MTGLSLRGAGVLAARYGLSTLVNVANMFVLTWWIGPRAYGLFITAVALTTFLASISRAGLDTYLVRCEEASDRNLYNTVFTLTLAISVALMALGALAAPLLSRWYHDGTVVAPYLVLLLTVPMIGLTGPPMARLERELRFQTVATIEFIGQLLSFLVSGVLAWRGMTVWAPVSGHVAWQVFTLLLFVLFTNSINAQEKFQHVGL